MVRATGSLDIATETAHHHKKQHTSTKDKLKHLSYYRRAANEAWENLNLEPGEEINFETFKELLANQEIIILDTQAKRAFKAIDVQGDGVLGMSEYENFLMLYDIMGHSSSDLIIMDIFDYFKMVPNKKNAEFIHSDHEGLDYSAYLEGLHMLGVKVPEDLNEEEAKAVELSLKKSFMSIAKIKQDSQVEDVYLTYEQFKTVYYTITIAVDNLFHSIFHQNFMIDD